MPRTYLHDARLSKESRRINYRLSLSIVTGPTILDIELPSCPEIKANYVWREQRNCQKKNQRRDDLILFSIFVAGHWVAGRKHFREVKYFPHFENWPFVGSAWGRADWCWDGRQLCPMDRIKPTLWKMSPFGPGPTSHAQTNQPTHGFAKSNYVTLNHLLT